VYEQGAAVSVVGYPRGQHTRASQDGRLAIPYQDREIRAWARRMAVRGRTEGEGTWYAAVA
jgi:hypothetical protein